MSIERVLSEYGNSTYDALRIEEKEYARLAALTAAALVRCKQLERELVKRLHAGGAVTQFKIDHPDAGNVA